MPDYRTNSGEPTVETNPDRLVWYGHCSFWTDDWSKLSSYNGMPCCPSCLSVGFQTTYREWIEGAQYYQSQNNVGYVNFLLLIKERCHGRQETLTYLWKLRRINHAS